MVWVQPGVGQADDGQPVFVTRGLQLLERDEGLGRQVLAAPDPLAALCAGHQPAAVQQGDGAALQGGLELVPAEVAP